MLFSLLFEQHRDLHWGQILIDLVKPSRSNSNSALYMDHGRHGVKATIIDLGLSRMRLPQELESVKRRNESFSNVQFTEFEEGIFESEGM